MRVAWMGVTIVLMPVAAMAGTDLVATAIRLAPTAHIPIPNIKPASRAPRTGRINS
jgi:hypothetical protein